MIFRHALTALLVFTAFGVLPARAERLIVSVSNPRVAVTSSFVGETLVLFGTVEPDRGKIRSRSNYDLVVTVAGPATTLRTRRKERVVGIWVNVDAREFVRVPSYLAIISNRPIAEIAKQEVRRPLQVGIENFLLRQRVGPDIADTVPDDPFRNAFVHLQQEQELYQQWPRGVTFLTPTVFRATIPLPANAPTGTYSIDVKLFASGALAGRTDTALQVIKTGFEQYVADAARDNGFFYGLITAAMALTIGWLATVIFRQD
jgi:uncharacterized protein (TIGR02186 family)